MSDQQKNLPVPRERAAFLDKVRQSKALSAVSKKETLAKAEWHEVNEGTGG